MRLEHCGDRRAVPSEDQLLDWSRWSDAPRAKHCHAFSPFATNAIVRDSVCVSAAQLYAEALGGRIVARRVDVRKIALALTQIIEVRALHRRLENLEIQILRRRACRLEKSDAMVLHLRDRCRLVPRGVVDAERIRCERRRTEARSVGRRMDEWRHHVTRARSVDAVLGWNRERGLDPRIDQRIRARAEREEGVEIVSVRDFLEEVYRRKDRRDELYGLLPRQALRCEARDFVR